MLSVTITNPKQTEFVSVFSQHHMKSEKHQIASPLKMQNRIKTKTITCCYINFLDS